MHPQNMIFHRLFLRQTSKFGGKTSRRVSESHRFLGNKQVCTCNSTINLELMKKALQWRRKLDN